MLWLKTFDGRDGNKKDLVEFLMSSVNCVMYDIETGYIKEIRSNSILSGLSGMQQSEYPQSTPKLSL